MERRSFLRGILAAAAAPAIVRAESLSLVARAPTRALILPVPQFVIGRYEGFRFIQSEGLQFVDRPSRNIRVHGSRFAHMWSDDGASTDLAEEWMDRYNITRGLVFSQDAGWMELRT